MKNPNSINWNSFRWRGSYNREPAPFPGLHPTRWHIEFVYAKGNKKRRYVYNGKPCKGIAILVLGLMKKYSGKLWLIEFDRKGPMYTACANTPTNQTEVYATDWNYTVCAFYYPLLNRDAVVFSPWRNGYPRKKFILGGKSWISYSNELTYSQVKEYRKWLLTNAQALKLST